MTPLTKSDLARALNLSRPTLNKYISEGLPPDDLPAARAWVEERRAVETRGGTGRTRGKPGETGGVSELKEQLLRANIMEREASARIREFEAEVQAKNLVPLDEARGYLAEVLGTLRVLLDGLPKGTAIKANPSDPQNAEEAIREALDGVYKAMDSAAKGDAPVDP